MTSIEPALNDLLNDQTLPLEEAMDRHFSPGYRQRTDGVWSDRAEFAAHIAHLRALTESTAITVLDEFSVGHRYADRHIVTVKKRDGTQVVQEVYLFGERGEDGRFTRVEETTLMLEGAEHDRSLGSAR
jgi:hypothetical protein